MGHLPPRASSAKPAASRATPVDSPPTPVGPNPVAATPILRWKHRFRWLAVLAWMVVIFLFSSQVGEDSAGLSTTFTDFIARVGDQAGISFERQALDFVVRKGAHMSEYAILGALLAWAWRAWPGGAFTDVGPILMGVIYAASDEVHQLFVPGRSGQVSDVIIDAVGVFIGVIAVLVATWSRPRSGRR